MDRCLSFFSFAGLAYLLAAAAVGSHATSSSEDYWQKVLPNTHMPDSIREFFNLDLIDEKTGTNVDVGKGGVHVDTGKTKGGTTVDVGKGGVDVNTGKGQPKGGTTVGVGKGGVNVNTGKGQPKDGTTVGVGKGGVNVNTGHKGKPVVVNVKPGGKSPFNYNYAASTEQLHDPTLTLFFLEKDLHTGAKMNLIFSKAISVSKLPHGSVSGPSLDGKKLPEILNQFSIEPKSSEAEAIKETLQTCTEPANEGEDRYCATSVESMIDFTVSKIGTNVQALSTTVDKESSNQLYTIAPGVQKMSGPKSVACHAQTYVYPVYYCHETVATTAYVVPLVGMDGSKVKAVAVCHKDTSSWNPKHLSFQVLKVKPGSVPICHFIPQDHIVWVQK
ncbi:BURP domain protein RD22-like isoform X1 [Magnolia sinica]|uniref:BURP domain protein RD22-like isoform X1 n=1 Tax=Magnolia sinica TaxID=86752 RepID=UPI00265ADB32|nr:BURP domain protein RD22-like isoform X1 [Magnolia sinica]